MAKTTARIGFLTFCFSLAMLGVLARSAHLQLVQGDKYAKQALRTRTETDSLPARRGAVLDRSGQPLVVSQEQYHVNLAPDQVADPAQVAQAVGEALGIDRRALLRELRSGKKAVYRHGPFSASQIQPLRRLRGVHLEPTERRIELGGNVARATLQSIDGALDSILDGTPGAAVYLRDSRGRQFESPSRVIRQPVAGNDIYLTIDARLQEIAERALGDALDRMQAVSGDFIFVDPWTGEILALASQGRAGDPGTAVLTAPYEPGSTAKLLTAAALLERRRIDTTAVVSGEDGKWHPVPERQSYVITDDHPVREPMTLGLAVERSSNIGMAKFARHLEPAELRETLRDFGLGQPTGLTVADASGRLPELREWRPNYTLESVSRGYGLSVTPLQLALAYSAIANGGVLYAPSLVKQVRAPDGTVLYVHRPEPVRRVISEEVASALRGYLRGAVSTSGTGSQAQIQGYELVGKTGTARVVRNRRYVAGAYTSSFASIWPAESPQLVALVKIDEPRRGSIYGGSTAGPLTKTILEEALASRNSALELPRLAAGAKVELEPAALPPPPSDAVVPVVSVELHRAKLAAPAETGAVRVPDVTGKSVRDAAFALHRAGFEVRVRTTDGAVESTEPAAGTTLPAGAPVRLVTARAAR